MAEKSVIFFNRVYPPGRGATGRVLQELARSFAKKKWQVTIVTTGDRAGTDHDGPIKIVRVKGSAKPRSSLSYLWVGLKMLLAGLKQPKHELVVSMTDPPLFVILADWLARSKGVSHMHWCQDLFPDIFPALGKSLPEFVSNILRDLTYGAIARTEKTVVIGRCMARQLTMNGIDPRAITVIPNWPNFELVRVNSKKSFNQMTRSASLQEAENLLQAPQKFRVLYAGNLGLAHPYHSILDAAALLKDTHPEIEFVFVGDGPRFDYIARERSRRELENVRLMPYQPNELLKDLMESGDVHLISMRDEAAGFLVPSKLYSALAVQRPVILIGPEQSEAAKVLHDFGAGQVVSQNNAQALADAIILYRADSDAWFKAHEGAAEAGRVFVPNEAIKAWIKRADGVVAMAEQDTQQRQSA